MYAEPAALFLSELHGYLHIFNYNFRPSSATIAPSFQLSRARIAHPPQAFTPWYIPDLQGHSSYAVRRLYYVYNILRHRLLSRNGSL